MSLLEFDRSPRTEGVSIACVDLTEALDEREVPSGQTASRTRRMAQTQQRSELRDRILRSVLSWYSDVDPNALRMTRECEHCGDPDHGKPRISSPEAVRPLEFNLSHSQDVIVVAVGWEEPTGVDAEKVDEGADPDAVVEAALSEAEKAVVREASARNRDALVKRIWSRKEAYLKLWGKGLAVDLPSIEVAGRAVDRSKGGRWIEGAGLPRAWVGDLEPREGWVGAVAFEQPVLDVRTVRSTPERQVLAAGEASMRGPPKAAPSTRRSSES